MFGDILYAMKKGSNRATEQNYIIWQCFQDSNQESEKGASEQWSKTISYDNALKILTKIWKREQGSNRATEQNYIIWQYFQDSNQEL